MCKLEQTYMVCMFELMCCAICVCVRVCVNQGLVTWTFNGGTEIFQVSLKKKKINL